LKGKVIETLNVSALPTLSGCKVKFMSEEVKADPTSLINPSEEIYYGEVFRN